MPPHFVLIHGAYHGGWCWDRLAPLLEAKGVVVTAPDLPGHGEDNTPLADLSLAFYADHVASIITSQDQAVTLVGHSMAGAVIAEVAERIPHLISRLVYLSAYMPNDGQSISDWARHDTQSKAKSPRAEINGVACLTVDRETTRNAFYQEATEADLDWVFGNLRPEPVGVFRHRLTLTQKRFGSVPRDYISCRDDAAITAELQDKMLAALPIRQLWEMDCGHSPFVVCPEMLATVMFEGDGT